MKAICVVRERELEVREIPQPAAPADEHLLVEIEACAINPGDKYFLANPAERAAFPTDNDVWGASGVGRVVGVGKNVPSNFKDKRVAIYRSLVRTPETMGLWCEIAQVPYLSCVILPDNVEALDYAGSLVNVMTAFAFLKQIEDDGHKGVITTAGSSATGRALLELARVKNIPAIALCRTSSQKEELTKLGFSGSLVSSEEGFESAFQTLARELGTTAVFEGVGGEIVTRIAPLVPMNTTFYFYGFLAGPQAFSLPSILMMQKGLVMRSFSNFMTRTVQDRNLLTASMTELSGVIDSPSFHTKIAKQVKFDEIQDAIKFQGVNGAKCLLIP